MSKEKINPKNIFTVNSLTEYIELIEKEISGYNYFYRGLLSKNYELLSTLGREYGKIEKVFAFDEFPPASKNLGIKSHIEQNEKEIFREFKFLGYPDLQRQYNISEYNDWELLSIGRHHGLITRFMDWTLNPLVGLYFSVYTNFKEDGLLFYFPEIGEIPIINYEEAKSLNPFEIERDYLFQPVQYSKRIRAQNGILLIQANPIEEFFTDSLRMVNIPRNSKFKILQSLNTIGINHNSLFPDLDGITTYINKNKYLDLLYFYYPQKK